MPVQNSEMVLHNIEAQVRDFPPHTAVAVSVLPSCDICRFVDRVDNPELAVVDGATVGGPWANMCWPHFLEHGRGKFGLGIAQRLVIPAFAG